MKKNVEVKIYSMPNCVYCSMAKEYLKQKGFQFSEIDVSKNNVAAKEVAKKSGQFGVPVLEIGDNIVIGFDKDQINKLLNISS